jgi:hypothetical protein
LEDFLSRWHGGCKCTPAARHDGARIRQTKIKAAPLPKKMKTESIVRLIVGTMILSTLALARYHNPNWIWLTAFVGFNVLQSSLTGFCPSEIVIRKLRGETAN